MWPTCDDLSKRGRGWTGDPLRPHPLLPPFVRLPDPENNAAPVAGGAARHDAPTGASEVAVDCNAGHAGQRRVQARRGGETMSERTPLDHARDLLARGLAPIPVPFREKGPKIPNWGALRLTESDLPRYFCDTPSKHRVPPGRAVRVDRGCGPGPSSGDRAGGHVPASYRDDLRTVGEPPIAPALSPD